MNLCEKVAFIALKDTKGAEIWLEASTERSKSNPGRSLGLYKARRDRLSGRQYPLDVLTRLWLTRHVQKYLTDNPDATDF